jgi:hypothetical protein
VDNSSFISSFRAFRRVPAGALLAAALFLVAESAVALLWRPGVVGERLYGRYSPSYDYGYGSDVPRLFPEGAVWRFYPTEYVNIRPFSIRRAKSDKEIRIFVLGPSVSRGSGLPEGVDYAAQLERALNEQAPEYEWSVINLSADGFGTTRMFRILIHMLDYRADAIIVHPHGTNEYEDERDARFRGTLRAGLNGLLLRSRLIVLLKNAELAILGAGSRLPFDMEDEQTASLHPENIARWQAIFDKNIERIECVSREVGIPAVFVGRAERDAPAFRNARVERLNAPIREAPFYVDAAAVLAKAAADHPKAALWYNNTHYSETGHAYIARELLPKFLPGGPMFDRMMSHRGAPMPRPSKIAARCANPQRIGVHLSGAGRP